MHAHENLPKTGRNGRSADCARARVNSSKYQRRLPEGIIIDKLSARNIVLSDSEESIHLLMDLTGRHPNDVTVYKIEELTYEKLVGLL